MSEPLGASWLEKLGIGDWRLDVRTQAMSVSSVWAEILGVRPTDVRTAEQWLSRIEGGDRPKVALELKTHLEGLSRRFDAEYRVRRPDGSIRWVRSRGVAERDEKGVAHTMSGQQEDVTDRRALEEALRQSESRFRALVEASPDAIAVVSDGRFAFVNRRWVSWLGFEASEQLTGGLVLERIHPEDFPGVIEDLRDPPGSGESRTREVRLLTRQGAALDAELSLAGLPYSGRPAILVFARDIGERKRIQTRLAETDRMASLGTLAAGVAHEINNPLAYVVTNIELIIERLGRLAREAREVQSTLDGADRAYELSRVTARAQQLMDPATFEALLELARDAGHGSSRVHQLVADLKIFGRATDERRGPVELKSVLDLALKIAHHQLRRRARVHVDAAPGLLASGNEGRFCQVFVNLLVNAAQAITSGTPDDNAVSVRLWREGDQVIAEIRDTGDGIKPEHMPRLFDPFFTTKPAGVGSGLGLPICRHIVEDAGGAIRIESELGRGTTVTVRLPAYAARVEPTELLATSEEPVVEIAARPGEARHRILLVDDEPALLRALERELGQYHDVVLASTGQEALAVLARDRDFSLVLCDLVMLGVTGEQVFAYCEAHAPELCERFVFITGGATEDTMRAFLERIDNLVLYKPVELRRLRRLLRGLRTDRRAGTPETRPERRTARRFRASDIAAIVETDGQNERPSGRFPVVDFSASGLRVAGGGPWSDGDRFALRLDRGGEGIEVGVRLVRVARASELDGEFCVQIEHMDPASHDTYQRWLAGAS